MRSDRVEIVVEERSGGSDDFCPVGENYKQPLAKQGPRISERPIRGSAEENNQRPIRDRNASPSSLSRPCCWATVAQSTAIRANRIGL